VELAMNITAYLPGISAVVETQQMLSIKNSAYRDWRRYSDDVSLFY
jgi:hypothetical protein